MECPSLVGPPFALCEDTLFLWAESARLWGRLCGRLPGRLESTSLRRAGAGGLATRAAGDERPYAEVGLLSEYANCVESLESVELRFPPDMLLRCLLRITSYVAS